MTIQTIAGLNDTIDIDIVDVQEGNVNITSTDGIHNVNITDVLDGNVDIFTETTGANQHSFFIDNIQGYVDTRLGTGSHDIDLSHTLRDVYIKTDGSNGSGSDDVDVSDTGGDLTIVTSFLSSGSDFINILRSEGNQNITTGAGNDTIVLYPVPNNTLLTIDAGNDNDRLEIDGLFEADAEISSGEGNDVIILNNATDTPEMASQNAATLASSDNGNAILFQRDRMLLEMLSYSINIATDAGNDEVFIKTIPEQCTLRIDAGDDDDVIRIDGLGYGSNATVLGGKGDDLLFVDGRESEEISDMSEAANTMVRS